MTQGCTVLLLNFNADERDTYRQALIAAGFDVIVCIDPLDAMRVAAARRPGALVTRILQPNCSMDGVELTRRIKTDPRTADTHIVITMSFTERHRRSEAFEAGCDECLLLPSSASEVVESVRRLLATADVPGTQESHDVRS